MSTFDSGTFGPAFDAGASVPKGALYWGAHFPESSSAHYWGPHFPDGVPDATLIPGFGPAGVATLVLDLQSGAQVTYSWATDVRTMYSGKQFRAQPLDDPKQLYTGIAILSGPDSRIMRGRLARYAAIGAAFLLALPYEAITLSGPASGKVLPVATTANSDWMALGQRCALTDQAGNAIDVVIQDFDGTHVTIDVDPGALGRYGCMLMPCVPVYLDPQQGFQRYRGANGVEGFQIKATAATFGYGSGPRAAFAVLDMSTGALASAVISAATMGAAGNVLSIQCVEDFGGLGGGSLTNTGSAYTWHFNSVTTVDTLLAAVVGIFALSGSFDPAATMTSGDVIGPIALMRGADKSYGTMGVGATIATYHGAPVWDRPLQIDDTATDSIQALTELVDLGGIPIAIGTADAPDWGRQVMIDEADIADWQWVKAFLSVVRGRQVAFWLPTWRPDLIATAVAPGPMPLGTLTIENDGTLDAWFPALRTSIQTVEADGTISYVEIESYVDNGDGTLTLTISNVLATTPTMVSWLDLCSFNVDAFPVTWTAAEFAMNVQARAVQQ